MVTARCLSGDERISRSVLRNSFEDRPDLLLAGGDLSTGLGDALDESLEPDDDLVDLLLVQSQVLEGVQDRLLEPVLLTGPEPADLVDDLADTVDVPLLVELGVLLVDVPDDLLDADLVLAELVAQAEDLLDRDGGLQHHLQHAPVAVFDALGDLDLALAREQRDRPHLAHVRPHRIAGGGVAVGVLFLLGLLLRLELVAFFVLVRFVRVRVLSTTLTFAGASMISMPSSANADSQSSI